MNGSGTSSSELLSALTSLGWAFPFERELSLRPLIAFWEETIAPEKSIRGRLARDLQEEVRRAPELSGPINDLSVLTRHHELVDALMAAVFPTVSWQQDHAAALIPFELRSFYATPSFERDLTGADGKLQGRLSVDKEAIARFRLLNAYSLALARIYGISFPVDYPIIFTVEDRETGLDRHFKIGFEGRFIDVEPAGTLPALAPDVRARLEARAGDFKALAAVFPPGSVRFRGFTVFRALDVTDQEVLSSLKRDLIDKESIVSSARFDTLQTRLRTLLRRPDLRLGLAAIEGDRVLELSSGASCEHACIFADSVHRTLSDYDGLGVPPRLDRGQAPVHRGPRRLSGPDGHRAEHAGQWRPEPRGLAAPLPGRHDRHAPPHVTPARRSQLAAGAANRGGPAALFHGRQAQRGRAGHAGAGVHQGEVHGHPSGRRVALPQGGLRRPRAHRGECDRSAVGDGGHRLFRRLSALRDRRHPRLVHAAGRGPSRPTSSPSSRSPGTSSAPPTMRGRCRFSTSSPIASTRTRPTSAVSLRSGDEMAIIGFLRTEIEARFDHLQGFGTRVRERIEAYRRAVDPRVGAIYAKRRDFDESVTRITEAISSYIDLEEQAAQAMYPHYFEKQQTDGVDYSIYVGGSLLEEGGFDPLYLKNLRLWQLMVACGVAIRAERLKDQLATPLEVTNLILVQHAPLSIRFRFDEKRFDVDGAYNVRYEIIKKRIDKAVIRGTAERLTQPGQVALVYSHPSEAHEWREYIDYLQTLGYLTRDVEELELEELQGAQGLRALRVRVDTSHGDLNTRASLAALPAAEPAPAS